MKMRAPNYMKMLSWLLFFSLFPGFFFYHNSIASGLIPPFIGGAFSPVSLAGVCLYALGILFIRKRYLKNKESFFYLSACVGFGVYCLIWVLIQFAFSGSLHASAAALQSLQIVMLWSALYCLGFFIEFNSKVFFGVMLASVILIFFIVANFVWTTGSFFYYARNVYDVADGDTVATYQEFARSAIVSFIFVATVWSGFYKKITVLCVGLFVLYVLGARSELYIYAFITVLFLTVSVLQDKRKLFVVLGIMLIATTVVLQNFADLSSDRQAGIFNLRSDDSWVSRESLAVAGYRRLIEAPFIGDFTGQYELGGRGNYIHNILSAWASFGFLGFIWYFALIIFPVVHSSRVVIYDKNADLRWVFTFYISVMAFVLLVFAKSIYWPMPALAWGLYLRVLTDRHHKMML